MNQVPSTANPPLRYHYLDNLRALAMLAGVVFHAGLAYSPMMHFFWLTADTQSAKIVDSVAWFSHLFRMPLFFLIAGFFGLFLIEKRGIKSFLFNRSMRVLLPLIIFLPVVLHGIVWGIEWAAIHVKSPSPALAFVINSLQGESAEQPIQTAHLWFLYYLCFFYVLTLILWKIKFFHQRVIDLIARPWVMLVIIPGLLFLAFFNLPAPHPAPETLKPLLWPFGLYGLFFLLGAVIFKKQALLTQMNRHFIWMLVAGLASYGYFNYRVPAADGQYLMAAAESITAVYMTWVCLLAGKKLLNQHNKTFRYIADSSYWIYIIHMPVLFMVQYVFLDLPWNLWLEFFLSTVITLGIGLISYALLVRWTPIGWLLNGRRKKSN